MYAITTYRLKSVDPEDLGHLILHIGRESARFFDKNGHAPTDEELEEMVLAELDRMDRDNSES